MVSYQRFTFSPSEATFLRYLWDHFAHWKTVPPYCTTEYFLSDIAMYHQGILLDADLPWSKRRLLKRFEYATTNPEIRPQMIAFLEANPFPREQFPAICELLRIAVTPYTSKIPTASPEAVPAIDMESPFSCLDMAKTSDRPSINARTYIVAAELYLEIEGKGAEFEAISCNLEALETFIKDKFGVHQLPGNFKAHKGHSYKKTLKDKSQNKKGQLKTCFRQIIDHPDVFGKGICSRAQQSLAEDFD